MKRRLGDGMRGGNYDPYVHPMLSTMLLQLPVAERDQAKKQALLKEWAAIGKQATALRRRRMVACKALDRLPVVNTMIDFRV